MTNSPIQRKLAAAGVILFSVGMLTGIWSAIALTGTVKVGLPRVALIAHLNALLGGLWLLSVAWTFNFLHYDEKGKRRLAFAVGLPAWSNWFVTFVASFLGVTGLSYTGNRSNDVIAFFLQVLVVIPTLIACGFWIWGFKSAK